MEKRIELELRGQKKENVGELILDNCRATQVEGLTDEFKQLEYLSMNNIGLTTLKGFPKLENLKKLELSDNKIADGLNHLTGCETLEYLALSGNKIKGLDVLEPLKTLKSLKSLDLFNCEVTSTDSYREKVFELLEGLVYLDGFDRNNEEADDEDYGEVEGEDDDEDGEEDDGEEGYDAEAYKGEGDEDEDDEENGLDDEEDDEEDDEDHERGTKRKFDEEEESGDAE